MSYCNTFTFFYVLHIEKKTAPCVFEDILLFYFVFLFIVFVFQIFKDIQGYSGIYKPVPIYIYIFVGLGGPGLAPMDSTRFYMTFMFLWGLELWYGARWTLMPSIPALAIAWFLSLKAASFPWILMGLVLLGLLGKLFIRSWLTSTARIYIKFHQIIWILNKMYVKTY